ncbi:O-methyltransferase, putative [Plesiocystis pacifica SIR-1]|uniref:O-methyltransferase, putative n=1 Tax=Plesiocystis pacifica SIR-1 TaxID=391625 RepID=A6G6X9_9BACT|nr:class I SAM-dependent methyltransferase [Plesiocystis pacifica]EDM78432.1 O-methyltransferase, putative [Plesiocystis pacifica SIR-1]
MKRRFPDDRSNLEARFAAQRLAFGPMMFQATRVLRRCGALAFLYKRELDGASVEELAEAVDISLYAARILLEAGLAAELVQLEGDRYVITRVGYFVLRDPMTEVNMNFVHDVCYRSMFHFEEALAEGKPAGLREHGDWATVYEGLTQLPTHVRDSWLAFDHYYSDGVFEGVLPKVFASEPARVLDVGGNTGKFALACCGHDPKVEITIVDLPRQLELAKANLREAGVASRVEFVAANMLDPEVALPGGHDVIWMSQFLDCFSEAEIVHILECAARVMDADTRLYILETYWDRQDYEAARYAVINTSLYFTAIANGNSKMYHSERMQACLEQAGLVLDADLGTMGYHTLFRCKKAQG